MKRVLYPLGVLTTALAMFGALAAPASASVHRANWGDRGSAWTNSAHTRLGVQDNRSDRIRIYVEAYTVGGGYLLAPDVNDSAPGYSAYPTPDGREVATFRVCGWQVDDLYWVGCGNWVTPND